MLGEQAGVAHLVHSCVEPAEFSKIQVIAQRYPEISIAIGLHPLDVDKWTDSTAEEIAHLAPVSLKSLLSVKWA